MEIKEIENKKIIDKNNIKYNKVINDYKFKKELDKKRREEYSDLLKQKSEKIDNSMKYKNLKNEQNIRIKEKIGNNRREFGLEYKPILL